MASGKVQGGGPQMNYGPEGVGPKALFHSRREQALIMDKTCMP